GAAALCRQPFMKGLRVDVEICKEFTPIQIGRRLQLGPVRRMRQLVELVEVNDDVLKTAFGKVGDQVTVCARPHSLAQFQQTIAKAVASLFGPMVGPQQVGEPFAADCLASLRRYVAKQSASFLRDFPKPTI